MRKLISAFLLIILAISLIVLSFTIRQVDQRQKSLTDDLQYRSALLVGSLADTVETYTLTPNNAYLQRLVDRYSNDERIVGMAVYDNKDNLVALTTGLDTELAKISPLSATVMDANKANGITSTYKDKKIYLYATPLTDKDSVIGALMIVQNASYIDDNLATIWRTNMLSLLLQLILISFAIAILLYWLIYKPIRVIVEGVKDARLGKVNKNPMAKHVFFQPLLNEVSNMQHNLIEARIAASEEARLSLEKLDSPWTAERLNQFAKDVLKGRTLVVVSVREPYIHTKEGNTITYKYPVTGVVTAIEPVLKACGGLWIAQGSGDADRLVVDKDDKIAAPPDNPKYTLKRVWLSDEEVRKFYYGASKLALYPLNHMVYTKPIFRHEDWEEYKLVNKKFAEVILKEIKHMKKPVILLQDFHFVIVPQLIKDKRPDATVEIFWHIPWIHAEAFSSCPWKKEILDGMLGADLLGFHTRLHCNNFIESVGKELEALIDFETFSVKKDGHTSLIRPFPVSVSFTGVKKEHFEEDTLQIKTHLLKKLGIKSKYIGIGVDRLDNIKGVIEKIRIIEAFFTKYPSYIHELTFIQLSVPANTKTEKTEDYAKNVEQEIERVNNKFKTNGWKPIIFINHYHSHQELDEFYRIADFCFITSLHEGMNLVSKEYIASRDDEKGVLILSQFAGASKELVDALIINPYDADKTADALYQAVTMSNSEQTKRMKKLRNTVKRYNIYRWAAENIRTIVSID